MKTWALESMTIATRRQMLAAAAAAAGLPLLGGAAHAALTAGPRLMDFKVYRNGSEIGYHRIDLKREDNRITADIDILLEVGVGPITLYRYRHKNREEWEDGQFVRFQSETDDDGDPYAVLAERRGDVIRIEREHDDDYETDDLTLLPTTYWNPETVNRRRLIDTQKGRIFDVGIDRGTWQRIDPGIGPVEARRYRMSGDLSLDLWYDRTPRLMKISFELKGDEFDYQLA